MITLCERLAGQDANVTTVPVSILRLTRQLTRFFEWTNDVADRLAFSEVTTTAICSFFLSLFLQSSLYPSSAFRGSQLLQINGKYTYIHTCNAGA